MCFIMLIIECISIRPMKWSMNATHVDSLRTLFFITMHLALYALFLRWILWCESKNSIKISLTLIRFAIKCFFTLYVFAPTSNPIVLLNLCNRCTVIVVLHNSVKSNGLISAQRQFYQESLYFGTIDNYCFVSPSWMSLVCQRTLECVENKFHDI